MRFPSIAAACVIVLAGCAAPQHDTSQTQTTSTVAVSNVEPENASPSPRGSAPAPSASASPTATPTATPVPREPASSAASGSKSVAPSATPAGTAPPVTPAPSATPLMLPPNAPPRIVDLQLDKTVVQAGETVSGTVETSSNVASVEARIATYSISVPKVAPGRFTLSYEVPNIPFFLKRTYDMVVIARNTAGVKATRTVPITIR